MSPILFLVFLLFYVSNASVQDFCVADLQSPSTPSGYPCKNPANLTVDDFVFTGFRNAGNIIKLIKLGVTVAFAEQFPAVNGLGLSFARADFVPGGFFPPHTHRGATEAVFMMEGTVTFGFISSANTVYMKELSKGDVMIFPQGLLHFSLNTSGKNATAFVTFTSQNPGLQNIIAALFGNNLPSSLVEQTTLLDHDQVVKLKKLLGGSG